MRNTINRDGTRLRFALCGLVFSLTLACFAFLGVTGVLTPVFSSNTTDATYSGIIRVTNNGTTTNNVFTTANINTQVLIDGGYVSANVQDSAIIDNFGDDAYYMPAPNSTALWSVFVPTINLNGNLDYTLYTGGDGDMDGLIRYFPGPGGMTRSDNSTLELADNFTLEWGGYLDVSGGDLLDRLAYKEDAFIVYNSGSGNITAGIIASSTNTTETRVPDGAGDETNIPNLVGAATHWEAVDDPVGVPDDDTTYVMTDQVDTWARDLYEVEDSAVSASDIRKITVTARAKRTVNWAEVKLVIKTGGTVYESVTTGNIANVYTNYSTDWTTNPGTGEYWTWDEIDDLQIGVSMRGAAGASAGRCTQVYLTVTYLTGYTFTDSVVATGVSSGNHTLSVSANVTDGLRLYIDGTLADNTTLTANVTDNAHDWRFAEHEVMPYMEYQRIYRGDRLDQSIEWENDDTTFHDRSYYGIGFDGADDRVNLGNGLDITGQGLTLELWARVDSFANSDNYACFAQNYQGGTGGYMLQRDAGDSELFFGIWTGGFRFAPAVAMVEDVWYHIVATFDGVDMNLYFNDALVSTTATASGENILTSASPLEIGGVGAAQSLDGDIDEFRIYSRVISAAERTFNYNAGVGSYSPYDTTDLNGWWHFETGEGTNVVDSSGFGNDGTITGALWVNGHVPLPLGTSGTNDVTPSFRTVSSDLDVSAELVSFTPVFQAEADPFSISAAGDMVTSAPSQPSELYTEGTVSVPGAAAINAALTNAGIPSTFFWFPMAFLLIIASGIIAHKFAPTLLLKAIVIGVGILVASLVNIFGLWVLFFFAIQATAVIVTSRHFGWN